MELLQLRYFQKIARTGSMTRAAAELHISQPTLSQSLRRLEESLGCELFIHHAGKKLQLNECGILFLEKVDMMFRDLEEGVNLVREQQEKENTQITLVSSIHDVCSRILVNYLALKPDVRISHRLVEINSTIGMLMNDEIDFAITPCPLEDSRIDSRPLYTEEMFVVAGPTHHLYGKRTITREELLRERLICNYSEADRNCLDMIYEQENVEADIMLETNEILTIRELILCGAGVAIMPAQTVMHRIEEEALSPDAILRISDYRFTAPTCISKKKNRFMPHAASEFYDYIVEYCKKESELAKHFLERCPGETAG